MLTLRLNRKLHAVASKLVGQEEAHEFLHDLAKNLFGVDTMRKLTDQEGLIMLEILTGRGGENLVKQALMLINEHREEDFISDKQVRLIERLVEELGWSEDYLRRLVWARYNEYNWRYMPKWKAVRLIAYLISRNRNKKRRREK